jgi:hypothetical protein
MDVEEFYVPDILEEASAAKYQMVPTIPERIGNIYTMTDREMDQGKRRKCYDGIF